MARGSVVTLEPNMYMDASGIEAVVTVKGLPTRRHRFALDVPRARIRLWVQETRAELRRALMRQRERSVAQLELIPASKVEG